MIILAFGLGIVVGTLAGILISALCVTASDRRADRRRTWGKLRGEMGLRERREYLNQG